MGKVENYGGVVEVGDLVRCLAAFEKGANCPLVRPRKAIILEQRCELSSLCLHTAYWHSILKRTIIKQIAQ